MEYYSVIKKNELNFICREMDGTGDVMLSEIAKLKVNYYMFLLICGA
jgi:hypothetical protein